MTAKRSLRGRVNRRAFLRGAAGVSLALPFLESMPERSAWAVGEEPVFGLFVCTVGGVVASEFFPEAPGPLTLEGLTAAGKATSQLAAHAERLLFLTGINWPVGGGVSDSHTEGLCMALTGAATQGTGNTAMGSRASADVVIASKLHPGKDPLVLYAGNKRNGFVAERLSFDGPGLLHPAVDNPYTLYLELAGLAGPGGSMTPDSEQAARVLAESRNSIHDLVREELTELIGHPRLSAADRQRLQLHFDSIRDAEVTMSGMGDDMMDRCTSEGLDVTKLEALKDYRYDAHTTTEETARLHMSLVALAFACDYRRAASLQWGDSYDQTIYDVPSNDRGWKFSYVSHRAQSDGAVGDDQLAAVAHAEIDRVRMQSLAYGLDHFKARGLEDRSFVLWTNHYAEGPSHSFRKVPHILWGSAGGALKQGEYLDLGGVENTTLLATVVNAAVRGTGAAVGDFGDTLVDAILV